MIMVLYKRFTFLLVLGRFDDNVTVLDFDASPSESRLSQPRSHQSSGQYFVVIIINVSCPVD